MRRPSINLGRIDYSSEESFTAQLIALILNGIRKKELVPGQFLLSIPVMASYQGISRKPVQDTYRYLAKKKVLVSRNGQSTRISPDLNIKLVKDMCSQNFSGSEIGLKIKRYFVGMLVPTVESSLHSAIVRMIETRLYNHNWHMILGNYEENIGKLNKYLNSFGSQENIKKIILAPFRTDFSPRCMNLLRNLESKIILLATNIEGFDVPYVTIDNKKGGALVAEYLFDMGHRDIVFIVGPKGNITGEERKAGFLEFFQDKADVNIRIEEGDYFKEKAYRTILKLFRRQKNYTAIFSVNSLSCVGALLALQQLHLSVPDDVSLITFDDMEYPSSTPISVIAQPLEYMAEQVVSLVIKTPKSKEIIMTEPQFIKRKSVKQMN